MGVWGEYDDENDYIADVWIIIEQKVIPKCYQQIEEDIEDEYLAKNKIRREYAKNNPDKVYKAIRKWLTEYKKNIKKEKITDPYIYISGIGLKVCRMMQGLPSSDPLGSGIFD